jgi:hypothetical protein
VAYTTAEGRRELLDILGEATSQLGRALGSLGEAYEKLDEQTADRLEEELFGPTQRAFGRLLRVYSGFASRHGLTARTFAAESAGLPSTAPSGFIEEAVFALSEAGASLISLQESEPWTEVGDDELRAGVAEVRRLVDDLPQQARDLVRTLGR